jgi:hypothetical protein
MFLNIFTPSHLLAWQWADGSFFSFLVFGDEVEAHHDGTESGPHFPALTLSLHHLSMKVCEFSLFQPKY